MASLRESLTAISLLGRMEGWFLKSVERKMKNEETKVKNEENKIIAEKRAKLEEIKKMATINKKGLFVMSASPLMVFGNDNLPNDIMKLLNIKNIAENQKGRNPIVTPEFIIKENPDMIITLLPNPSQIVATNPQLKNVNAIKNSKFIVVNSSQILRGSPRTIDQIEEIAKAVTK